MFNSFLYFCPYSSITLGVAIVLGWAWVTYRILGRLTTQ